MMQDSDMLLFVVYNLLRKKFSPEEQEDDQTDPLDHIAENESRKKAEQQATKNAYIHELIAQAKEARRVKTRPIDPVIYPEG